MKTLSVVVFGVIAVLAPPTLTQPTPDQIKAEYGRVTAELQAHTFSDNPWPVDTAPETPGLVAAQQKLAADWVAAWLTLHPNSTCEQISNALARFKGRVCLRLSDDAYAMEAPGAPGNVFIVTRQTGRYFLAWSTADEQESAGKEGEILGAWRMASMREEGSDPDDHWWQHGPLNFVSLVQLPNDTNGNARFYIQGDYPCEGMTVGQQITLWKWDGWTARPLAAHSYAVMIDQKVGTRFEGDLLRVQQKKSFRTFFSAASGEERQVDWVVRITPDGIEELGEVSAVPELDAVDELFFRIINGKDASEIASPSAIEIASEVVDDVREEETEEEWKKFPSLGVLMDEPKVEYDADGEKLLSFFVAGADNPMLITLRSNNGKLFISKIDEIEPPEE